MPSSRRLVKIVLGAAVSAGLLVYLFWNVDLRALGAHLARTHWGLLAACSALNLLSVWLRAWRWRYLFPPGARPTHLFNAVMIGYTGNNLLPLRAGEVLRVYVAARRGQRFWTAVATVVVERVLDVLAIVLMLAILLFLVPIPAELRWSALVLMGADLAAMAVLALVALAPDRSRALVTALAGRWAPVERRLLRALETFEEGLRGVRALRHLLPILAASVAVWLALALSIWAALQAARLDLPLLAAWTVLAFLGLAVSLPSSPGFIGIVQAATVWALDLFAVPRTEALSVALAMHAAQFFPVTLWGLALLLVEHVSLGEATRGARIPEASSRG